MNHDVSEPDFIPEDLADLARAHGVATHYAGYDGKPRQVSAQTLVTVLTALGVPASTPAEIALSLQAAGEEEWRAVLPPAVVVRQGREATFPVHVRDGAAVSVWIKVDGAEDGAPAGAGGRIDLGQVDHYVPPREIDGRLTGRATFLAPGNLPLGWHSLHTLTDDVETVSTLIVTPARMESLSERFGEQLWGMLLQLYSVRSRASWGLGDLSDLADLAWMCAERGGADFIAVNPISAAEPGLPQTPSPYLPTSRRWLNPIYVRVEDIPETGYLSSADRSLVDWAADPARALDTDPGPIDRDTVWTAKKAALEVVFQTPRRPARQAEFDAFVARQGKGLQDFALWCAITEHFEGQHPAHHHDRYDCLAWPEDIPSPEAPRAAELREQLAERVAFFTWLQWVADEQKGRVQRVARQAGMRIGVMHDLAVGVHLEGADAWTLRRCLATGVQVGAPPDMYNQVGQDWSQPPWNPRALKNAGYRPYRDLIRTVVRHAGALRVDHILGLFRLWWIPTGAAASEGTYVSYDHHAMVGILCLEAAKAGAVVVGEDLGTFEPWVREYLADYGLLGTSITWFEQADGRPLPPERYRPATMASIGTHDMPPTAGYLQQEHVDLAERLGLLLEPADEARARERKIRDVYVADLIERGYVGADPSEREIIEGMHRFLRHTASQLIGVQLVDCVGERRSQNQPGTNLEYPNWKVPLADSAGQLVLIDDLWDSQRLRSLLAVLDEPR